MVKLDQTDWSDLTTQFVLTVLQGLSKRRYQRNMGIKGLARYVNDMFKGWKEVTLQDCPLVVDGNGLNYHLISKGPELDAKFGGQYLIMKQQLENFFEALLAKKVQPIRVVMDGIDLEEKKFEEVFQRKRFHLHDVKDYLTKRVLQTLILCLLLFWKCFVKFLRTTNLVE